MRKVRNNIINTNPNNADSLEENHDEKFECKRPKEGCVKDNEDYKKLDICPHCPCPINKIKFGIHRRVIDYYLTNENWRKVYYYFTDLLSLLRFNCDIDQYDNIIRTSNKNLEEIPPGCRVFVLSNEMNTLLDRINKLEGVKEFDYENLSSAGKKNYKVLIYDFTKKMRSSLEILIHLHKDYTYKESQEMIYYKKLLGIYESAFKAKKEGLIVQDGVGSQLEKGFIKLGEGANISPQLASVNQVRIEQAQKEMKRNKIIKEFKEKLAKGEEISEQEINRRFKEIEEGR